LSERHLTQLADMVGDFDRCSVADTNHHTVLLSVKGAKACAEALETFAAELASHTESARA
jgi:hypothetical protein